MRWRLFLLILVSTLSLLSLTPYVANAQDEDSAAQQALTAINGWRIDQGLWPLRENPILDQMAFDQASYILSLPSIPGESAIHNDAHGNNPMVRAGLPQYNWPDYGGAQYTAVGEIAYVGFSVTTALNFWENSTIHRNTMINAAYREIGVAALPVKLGHLYFVDFGSRPDVLPVIPDLKDHLLYLSNERYSGARSPFIGNVSQVRLFDADGRPLEADWMPWEAQIPLPEDVGNQIFVEYVDSKDVMVLSPVSLEQEQVVMVPTLTPTPTPTSTPYPTQTLARTATTTPRASSAAATGSASTPTASGTVSAGSATRTPTPAPTNSSGLTNVLLIYDAHAFALVNSTKSPLNVQDIVFKGQKTSFAVKQWATQWLSGSLTTLAGSDCLEVWSWLDKVPFQQPSVCRQRRSILTIAPDQLFWLQGDFEVHFHDSVLAVCHSTDAQCAFAVPAS